MKSIITLGLTLIYFTGFSQLLLNQNIHIDQFGYTPDMTKVAVLGNPQVGYNSNESYTPSSVIEVVNAETNEVVYSGSASEWNSGATHSQSGDQGWWFDFSSVTEEGTYFIRDINSGQSWPFKIKDNVYQDVMSAATRMYFYNRCNAEKQEEFAGEWNDGMNFTNPLQDSECRYVYDPSDASIEKDLTGGWFDAGDYNKYVTFAESAVHNLLWAYQENPEAFSDDTSIPESGNGIPDILDELKWELDWLMKMCNEDGSVHIKMGSISFSENVDAPPSANTDQRYYGPTCTSASLAASGMLAHAAEVFGEISSFSSYAEILRSNAETCFEFALPYITNNTLETNCDDGTVLAGDADRTAEEQIESAVIAAVHLLSITEEADYNEFVLEHAYDLEPISAPFWGPYKLSLEDALLHYTQLSGSDGTLGQNILDALEQDAGNNWNDFFGFNDTDLYRAYMPDWSYHWGSNSPKAGYGVLNSFIDRYNIIGNNAGIYESKAAEQLHYFHGVNPLNMVMLSNMEDYGANNYVTQIYHTWFDHNSEWDANPAPGFVTGGPNADFSVTTISPPANQPIQKSYLDFNEGWPESSWEISEPAIYYQAIYIRLLANNTVINTTPDFISESLKEDYPKIFPNPATHMVNVTGESTDLISVYDFQGKLVIEENFSRSIELDVSELNPGVYLVKTSLYSQKLVVE